MSATIEQVRSAMEEIADYLGDDEIEYDFCDEEYKDKHIWAHVLIVRSFVREKAAEKMAEKDYG